MSGSLPTTAGKGYLVKTFDTAPVVQTACGTSTRVLTHGDHSVANLHSTLIHDSAKHYHRDTTEIYYVLEGRGRLELNDDVVEVAPGMLIVIEPGTWHRLRSEEGVRTLVIGVPPLHPADEYLMD